tara:strand:+ start:389 stop:724 length:336 start_codon:yes stop_codon:yes gene_type:complete
MNDKDVLFDIKCLDAGLPPMSRTCREIVDMIIKAPKADRRRMSRKLRKITKIALKEARNRKTSHHGEEKLRAQVLRAYGLSGDQTTFSIKVLERRVVLVKKFLQGKVHESF